MNSLSNNFENEKTLLASISGFCKEYSVAKALKKANAYKSKGVPVNACASCKCRNSVEVCTFRLLVFFSIHYHRYCEVTAECGDKAEEILFLYCEV